MPQNVKNEEEEFNTGPLSVLMMSVKNNTQVIFLNNWWFSAVSWTLFLYYKATCFHLYCRCLLTVGTTRSFSVVWELLIVTAIWFLRMSGRCGLRLVIDDDLYCLQFNFYLQLNNIGFLLSSCLRLGKARKRLFQLTRIDSSVRCFSEEILWSLFLGIPSEVHTLLDSLSNFNERSIWTILFVMGKKWASKPRFVWRMFAWYLCCQVWEIGWSILGVLT